jgi:hypothetical protein
MVNMIPPQVVSPPEPRGLRYGLLTAANGPLSLPAPHGLAGGVTYTPVGCGIAHMYDAVCHTEAASKEFDAGEATVERESFVAYASILCGSAGTTPAQLEDRVRRRLTDGEQTVAEAGMATILAAGATPLVPPVTTSLPAVVGELEQWLYGQTPGDAGYGYLGYLHTSPRIAAYATEDGLVVRDGQVLRTQLGTVWVFGGGYPDDGTIYISGQVTVWRSDDVFVTPGASAFNRNTNQYTLLAEREYAVSYDCVAASAAFDWQPQS